MFAPILVFGYNRPVHLRKALLAIESNPEAKYSDVYIFIDGPKPGIDNMQRHQECRSVAEEEYAFNSKTLRVNNENLGLAQSIRNGVDYVFEFSSQVIVIEDDIILSEFALAFLNEGLNKYGSNQLISCINSYQYPVSQEFNSCVALRGADCWGWATWVDRWESVDFNSVELLNQIKFKGLLNEFDLDGVMAYSSMLKLQTQAKIDSWAICWHASMFLQGKLCVYPPETLALNIGSDGTGTHSGTHELFETCLPVRPRWNFLDFTSETALFRDSLIQFYQNRKPIASPLTKLGRLLKKVLRFPKQ
jgi:hypothetical protein